MSEKNQTTLHDSTDIAISDLERDLQLSHGVQPTHDWGEVSAMLRSPTDFYDDELYSVDPSIRDIAKERVKESDERDTVAFIRFVDSFVNSMNGSSSVGDITEVHFDKMLGIIRDRAKCLTSSNVSFEIVEQAVDKIAECEMKIRMLYPGDSKSISSCIESIPSDLLKELYFYPSDSDKNVVAELLSTTGTNTGPGLRTHVRLLKKIYQRQDGEVVFNKDDPYVRKFHEILRDDAVAIEIASIPEFPVSNEQQHVAEFNGEATRIAGTIMVEMGLADRDENGLFRSAYLRSALMRLRHRKKSAPEGAIDTDQLRAELANTYRNLRRLGKPAVERLRDTVALENLWMYDLKELRVLDGLVDHDSQTIEHLKAGDVTVVFSNVADDHNGAIAEQANYKKQSGRTLRFEAAHVENIYRQMIFLNRLGIRPATLVYESHGNPGTVTDGGRMLWAAEPEGGLEDYKKNEHEKVKNRDGMLDDNADGLYRLARDYMQANRGIDSDDELVGKKQIIISACSSDQDFRQKDGTSTTFLEKVSHLVAHPSEKAVSKGKYLRRDALQNDVVFYGAANSMHEVVLENNRIGFINSDDTKSRSVTTKRTVDEPALNKKIFGTSRHTTKSHALQTRKGIPVRRAS